jgi:hypothetical protein
MAKTTLKATFEFEVIEYVDEEEEEIVCRLSVKGATFENKEVIKTLGYRWDPLNKCWYADVFGMSYRETCEAVCKYLNRLDAAFNGIAPVVFNRVTSEANIFNYYRWLKANDPDKVEGVNINV